MAKNKKLFFIFVFSLIFLNIIFSCLASAAGIAGAVNEKMFFEPDLERNYTYFVNSNTDKVMDHIIDVSGDLAEYFTLSTTVLKDLAPGEETTFTAKMKLPSQLEPGKHSAYICVLETKTRGGGSGSDGGEGASIGTRVRVCGVIRVFSPSPGKHAEFELIVQNVSKGQNALFELDVTCVGTEEVDVKGTIEVYGQEIKAGKETKIITLQTQQEHLKTGQKALLKTEFNTSNCEIGEYNAKATLYFASSQATKEKDFRIGTRYIEILNFTQEAVQNKLNPIAINVQSMWNSKIKDVYASIEITDSEKNIIDIINSPPADIEQWGGEEILAYWDTKDKEVKAGEYGIKITLHYEGEITIKEGKLKVKRAKMQVSLTGMLIIALIIIIIASVILIMSRMKKMQGQEKQKLLKKKTKK